MPFNPTQRFSDRADDYARYRPGYPAELITFLHGTCQVPPTAVVADIGAGTGLSTRLFLDAGHPAIAVEPNAPMLTAADRLLRDRKGYSSVNGSAEHTTLPDASVDLISAGTAFHWFEREATRQEFRRILRPDGGVTLFWNSRVAALSPLLHDYEEVLLTYGDNYAKVAEAHPDDAEVEQWFAGGLRHTARFANPQWLDAKGLRGRLLSSSAAPQTGHPNHVPMLTALQRVFEAHAVDGRVCFDYQTRIYFGQLPV